MHWLAGDTSEEETDSEEAREEMSVGSVNVNDESVTDEQNGNEGVEGNNERPGRFGDPKWACLREEALKAVNRQAEKMKRSVRARHDMELKVGHVVQYRLSEFDRTKVDYQNMTAMVVAVKSTTDRRGSKKPLKYPKYRIATRHGYLDKWLDVPCLGVVDLLTARPILANLEGVADMYRAGQLTGQKLRALARKSSLVPGGQGMIKCGCRTDRTLKNRCKCRRAGRLCGRRCHRGNTKCRNCHED